MKARLGAPKAITTTAHKLARLIYCMLRFGTEYVDPGQDYYERRYQSRVVSNLMRRAQELGYKLYQERGLPTGGQLTGVKTLLGKSQHERHPEAVAPPFVALSAPSNVT
jgi:hypothetical protein